MNKEDKQNIINRYKNLNKDQQEKVVKKLIKSIKKYEDINIQKSKENECKLNGHIFGKWEHDAKLVEKIDIYDRNRKYNVIEHKWTRVCERCGFNYVVNTKPIELLIKEKECIENNKKLSKRIDKKDI